MTFMTAPAEAHHLFASNSADCSYVSGNDDPFAVPPANCVSLANNAVHAVAYAGLGNEPGFEGIADAMTFAINDRLNGQTVMTAYVDQTDPVPDVVAMDSNYGNNNARGWVDCPSTNTGVGGTGNSRWCRGQYLRFNAFYAETVPTDTARRSLACHELGHTVGLNHDNNSTSCMQQTSFPTLRPTTYSQDDIDEIAATY